MSDAEWTNQIPAEQGVVYGRALGALKSSGVACSLGGAFALAHYTGAWRNTKDLDLYILPADRGRATNALRVVGLQDYFAVLPYDRAWITRSHEGGTIVDLIWTMANQRAQVDELWIESSERIELLGYSVPVCPVEELLWAKLYVMQRDRCDWPDVMRLPHHRARNLDWDHLLYRLGEDRALLAGALSLFAWLAPEEAREIDAAVLAEAHSVRPRAAATAEETERQVLEAARLLDSRAWFF